MTVTRAEVERIARLAALSVDEASLPALTQQIARILDYVSRLEAVQGDGDDAEDPPDHGPNQPLRPDLPRRADLARSVAEMAPAFRDGLFLVPRLGALDAGGEDDDP